MYQIQQVKKAQELIESYKGLEPFHLYLKKYFAVNKKHGSTDRKNIGVLCFGYYRLGKSFFGYPVSERIVLGLFLTSIHPSPLLNVLNPEWNKNVELSLDEKLRLLTASTERLNIFPFRDEMSEGVEPEMIGASIVNQPDTFIRIRPGFRNIVQQKLALANLPFVPENNSCLRFPPNLKLDNILEIGKEAVIQDLNSQHIGNYMYPLKNEETQQRITVWDGCAASGGKSILAYDINPKIDLTVSDIRGSILENLNKRFSIAGIKNYNSFIADLTDKDAAIGYLNDKSVPVTYDFIIADVPCTGSGTWGRTPEQLYYFKVNNILKYQAQQRRIIDRLLLHIKKGGYFLYITCSVFKKENEEQVDYILNNSNCKLLKQELLKGYDKRSDSLFVALFIVS